MFGESSESGQLVVPHSRLRGYGDRAFAVVAPLKPTSISDHDISPASSARNIGVTFDSEVNVIIILDRSVNPALIIFVI